MWRKHKNSRWHNKLLIGVILAVNVITICSTLLLPTKVFAEDNYSPAQKVKAWTAGKILSSCSKAVGWDKKQTVDDLNNGGLFNGSGWYFTVGYLVNADNGKIDSCKPNEINKVFKLINEKPVDFLERIGLYKYDNSAGAYVFSSNNENAAKIILKDFEKKYNFTYGNEELYSDPMPKNMQYASLLATFNIKCQGDESSTKSGLKVPLVEVVDGKATKTEHYYLTKNGLGENDIVEVGLGIEGIGNDGKASCVTIAKKMQDTAEYYQKIVQTNYDDDNPNNDPTADDSGSSATTATKFTCSLSFNPLTWFLCPMIEGFKKAIDSMDQQINDMLGIDTNKYFGNSGENSISYAFKSVWENMRKLSLALLFISGLIMIIGTAVGSNVLDAYTVKKIFPRILIAAIAISISWPVISFIVDASNALGYGIRNLILSPFADVFTDGVKVGGGQITVGAIGAVGVALVYGPVGILFFMIPAFLAVLVGFTVLILRQILIVFLAVMAPVAIAAYILPNTQKAAKIWWTSFSGALLAFPIISGFIAAGRAFALIAANDDGLSGNAGTIRGLIAFIAYFAPYFLIPQAFKMAGGALASLSGVVNDRSRGLFDRMRGIRQNQAKNNVQGIMDGHRFKGTNRVTSSLNTGLQNTGLIATGRAGMNPLKMRQNLNSITTGQGMRQIDQINEDEEYKTAKGDDTLNAIAAEWAHSGSNDIHDLERRLTNANYARGDTVAIAQAAATMSRTRAKMDDRAFEQMAVMNAIAGGTHYSEEEAWSAASRASYGNQASLANIVNKGRSSSMNAGRVDVGGNGFGATLGYANRIGELTAQRESLEQQFRSGGISQAEYDTQLANNELEMSRTTATFQQGVLDSQGAGTLVHPSMKATAIEALVPAMRQRLDEAIRSGDQARIDRELASVASIHDQLAMTAPNKAHIIAEQVLSWNPDSTDNTDSLNQVLTPEQAADNTRLSFSAPLNGAEGPAEGPTVRTIGSMVESARNSQIFNQTHRELSRQQEEFIRRTPNGGQPIGGGTIGGNPTPTIQ
ncbi:hypothetical protein KDA11_04550 [Candidatus Saccharibacteria bacterium]|nr:hypothetical protein [Candidatus Saccharibacteria bacterium]